MIKRLENLIEIAKKREKKTLAVAAAADKYVLEAVATAVQLNIVSGILIGDEEKIKKIASEEGISLQDMKIIAEKDIKKSADKAVELVRIKKADFIMKGMMNTSDILKAVLNKETGIKKEELLSHVMVYEIPAYHKLILLTDGGMVTYPELKEKIAIINNAVFAAKALEITLPKVAVICAVENVNISMKCTMDAAELVMMNKRGQIKNCIVDGPLGLDSAVSKTSAEHKGIISEVAGDADILLVPDIESGNFLGKSLTYFAKAENAGIIVGAGCPIVLVSRSDSYKAKLYSIALGSLMGSN